jgi:hypothetical protein
MWQNAVMDAGTVPGVLGQCDVNVFYGTPDDFRAIGLPADWPVQTEPPAPAMPPPAVDAVTASLHNLWSLTEDVAATNEARAISAQKAIVVIKNKLGL